MEQHKGLTGREMALKIKEGPTPEAASSLPSSGHKRGISAARPGARTFKDARPSEKVYPKPSFPNLDGNGRCSDNLLRLQSHLQELSASVAAGSIEEEIKAAALGPISSGHESQDRWTQADEFKTKSFGTVVMARKDRATASKAVSSGQK